MGSVKRCSGLSEGDPLSALLAIVAVDRWHRILNHKSIKASSQGMIDDTITITSSIPGTRLAHAASKFFLLKSQFRENVSKRHLVAYLAPDIKENVITLDSITYENLSSHQTYLGTKIGVPLGRDESRFVDFKKILSDVRDQLHLRRANTKQSIWVYNSKIIGKTNYHGSLLNGQIPELIGWNSFRNFSFGCRNFQ